MIKFKEIPIATLTQALVDKCQQSTIASTRKKLDGSYAIVSYDDAGGIPSELTGGTHYDLAGIQAFIVTNSAEWNAPPIV